MRYLFVMTVCLFCTREALADSDSGATLDVGLSVGPTWATRARTEGTPNILTPMYNTRAFIGASSSLSALSFGFLQLGVRGGVSVVGRGIREELQGRLQGSSDLVYLDLPLLAQAQLEVRQGYSVGVMAGPRFSGLLHAVEVNANGTKRDSFEFYDKFDFGLQVGIHARVAVSEDFALVGAGYYDYGMTNVDDSLENPGLRNRSFFLSVGIDYRIWRAQATPSP